MKDHNTNNLAQTFSNQFSFNDPNKATVVSGIMKKILVNQDTRNSMTGHDQMSQALKNKNLDAGFNTSIDLDKFFEDMQENELLAAEN